MSYITSSESSINHLWEMDRANYTLLLHFMCVRIWGVCTCVCVIQRSIAGVSLSYSLPLCFGRGSPIDFRARQFS